jgi:hypothetical protein
MSFLDKIKNFSNAPKNTFSADGILGVIDEPISSKEEDLLGLRKHSNALVKFITNTQSPITIGIQGQWGSGKTSLLRSIEDDLKQHDQILQIWINAWESSLLSNPEETFIKIINEIITSLLSKDENTNLKDKITKNASTMFRGALRLTASITGGIAGQNVVDSILKSGIPNIKKLREDLSEAVKEINMRQSNPYNRIVIYVDDLDRIEPKDAVKILELLKNIFNIPSCIFVLAIDYQVVVKGLSDKFKNASENEREYKSFFDKIIQLPFMMPVGQYSIGNYVKKLLTGINFGSQSGSNSYSEDMLTSIIKHTIGQNPRSLKRLVNTLSLIDIFAKETDDDSDYESETEINEDLISLEKQDELLFAIVCIQIAYPEIYEILTSYPDMTSWNDQTVYEVTQDKYKGDVFDEAWQIIQNPNNPDFDEPWEEALFKICFSDEYLNGKVHEISRILSIIKDEIIGKETDKNKSEIIAKIITATLSKTTITNISSTNTTSLKDRVSGKRGNRTDENKKIINTLWNKIIDHVGDRSQCLSTMRRNTWALGKHQYYPPYKDPYKLGIDFKLDGLIQIWFDNEDSEENLRLFDGFKKFKDEIQKEFGETQILWDMRPSARRQRIYFHREFQKTFRNKYNCDDPKYNEQYIPEEGWDELINHLDANIPKIEKIFDKYMPQIESK